MLCAGSYKPVRLMLQADGFHLPVKFEITGILNEWQIK